MKTCKTIKILALSCLMATLTTTATGAKATDFRFRHYTVDDGLPSATVRAIVQDRLGFLWFGTDNGLCRYNGISIDRHCFNPDINDQFVSCLHDDGTRLWIGTFKGIYLYDHATGAYSQFTARTTDGKGIDGDVLSITADKDGGIWVATMDDGAYRYSPRSPRLDRYPMKAIEGRVSRILVDEGNQVWAITNWAVPALWRLDKAKNRFVPMAVKGISHEDIRGLAMAEDAGGKIWIGTWDKGLVAIDRNGNSTDRCGEFQPQHIHAIVEYDRRHLLVGSDDGLALYDTANGTWRTFIDDETNPFSISNRFVYPITKDREGGVWIGTFYGGINYIVPNAGKFAAYSASRLRNSVGGNVINRFAEDHQGNIWIASDDGGLSMLDPKTDRFTNFTPANSQLSYINVHALCADGDRLWIGTYTGGINRMDIATGKFTHYQLPAANDKGTAASSCYSMFRDSRGRLWATSMDGIFRYDETADRFAFVKHLGALTIDIDEDRHGNIYFSTQGKGIFIYANGKFAEIKSLPSDQVNAMLIDTDGNHMIATQKGLCQYNPETGDITRIKLDTPSEEIWGIVEDNGTYWLATGNGLVRYQRGEPCQRFTKGDGMTSDQSLPNAMLKASDGRIYIGSQSGFNAFYPHEVIVNKTPPNVYITAFEVTNKPHGELDNALLAIVAGATGEIELPYDANSIVINFASLSYCAPGKNQYEYRLDGLDHDWTNSDGRTRATYTNLSPGTYTFRVRGSNNDGIWCNDEATLRIIVNPPFYLSLPMKIFYVLLAIAAAALGVWYMLRLADRKHRREIRRMKATQEKEMREAKIQFFTTIAHEIRTPVSLIIGPLENIMKSPATIPTKIRKDMDMIDRNAHRLLYLVNQLLDFRKVQTNSLVTHFKPTNMKRLIEAVGERFEPTFTQKGIAFTVVYPDDDFTAVIDEESITKVVSNFLTNANKYTRDSVRLECSPNADGETFSIVVADNGMGVRQEDQQRIFQPFYQAPDNKPGTGIGLSIVKSIVDQHGGTVSVKSVYGEGSTFTVVLPILTSNEQCAMSNEENDKSLESKKSVENETNDSLHTTHYSLKKTMLIVEDNDDMLAFIESNFKDEYNVITARDGQEGLERVKRNDIDLVLSDWMMPRMSGVELCRAVRSDANISHVPFILLTAKTDDESKAHGMECGADIYLEKPFSMQVLKSSIANMISLRKMLRERFSSQPLESITRISSNPVDSQFLEAMQRLIEDNLSNDQLSVNFLAANLNISRSALFSKMKTLADTTPSEMIQMVRLKTAARMLADGKMSVADVSYKVGFSSPSYFTKCFQKQFGMKPGEITSPA